MSKVKSVVKTRISQLHNEIVLIHSGSFSRTNKRITVCCFRYFIEKMLHNCHYANLHIPSVCHKVHFCSFTKYIFVLCCSVSMDCKLKLSYEGKKGWGGEGVVREGGDRAEG